MYLQKSHIGISRHQQGLRRCTMLGTVRWLLRCLLVMLLCYFFMMQSTPLFARSAAQVQDPPLVTQEIRYHKPEAGEVFFVWGINGWAVLPEEIRPAGTVLRNGVMHTPMDHEGDTFVARVRVPAGTTIRYGFLITKKRSGAAIESIWDGNREDYYVIVTQDGIVQVQTTLTLAHAMELPSILDIGLYLLIGIFIVFGIGVLLKRSLRLHDHRPDDDSYISRNTLQKEASRSVRPYEAIQDCLFLGLVVLLSVVLYVPSLGFYSDDWSFLGNLSLASDQSILGLYWSLYIPRPHSAMRPVQLLFIAGLYRVFGPNPIGYHLVNAGLLLSSVILFYLVLRRLKQRRLLTLAVPVVYALLPHYSTNRFWVLAVQINLSVALYFLSLYADLRLLQARPQYLWGWKLLSVLSLIASALAYEIMIPLFFLNLLLVWYHAWQLSGPVPVRLLIRSNWALLLVSNVLAIMLTMVFKLSTATRLGNQAGLGRHFYWIAKKAVSFDYGQYDAGLNIKQAIAINYGDYGLGLPWVVWQILCNYPDGTIFAMAVLVGLIIFGYLFYVARQAEARLPGRASMFNFIVLGLVVFGLGYAIFLTNFNVLFTTTGIGNRTAMAAAIGVALSLVGALGWVSALFTPDLFRRGLFCMLVTLLATSGFLINNTLASFWITAYRQEQTILTDIKQQFPTLPAGSTLIVDGICPYVGPAIVFESSWDLRGALQMVYRDPTIRADVVTPNLKIKENGLSTFLYGVEYHYPYQQLILYHVGHKQTYQLTDAETARRYFQQYNPDLSSGCARGHEGHGVPVF